MAELPRSSRTRGNEPVHFPAQELQVDGRSLHIQRLDAQTAVDLARRHNIAARNALVSATTVPTDGPARLAADIASSTLRTAVAVLTALNQLDGIDATAALDVDVEVIGAVVTARPHGELDLYTSPRLEQVCVRQLDDIVVDLLVVDLSAVTFLDSSALAVLVELHRVCVENRTRFAVTGPSARTRRLLQITQLDAILDVR